MLLSSLLVALAAEPLPSGIDLYERGMYEKSRSALAGVLDSASPQADKNHARLYLAADYFALGDRRGALYALEDLARQAPEQDVDTSVFPPAFIQLWEEALSHVTAERPAGASQAALAPAPVPSPPPTAAASLSVPLPHERTAATAPGHSRRLLAVLPAAAAVGMGAWGLYSFVRAQSLYGVLTGSMPPASLSDGESIAAQGRTSSLNAAIGAVAFAAGAALALSLLLLL
jgi:hypothetical protein